MIEQELKDDINNSQENISQNTSIQDIDKTWDRFIALAKNGRQTCKFPRKSAYLDADLHKGLKELKIIEENPDKTSLNDLMNAIVRAFIEVHKRKLKEFRKYVDVKSVFDTN